jgi:hypothetical protein
MTFRLLCLAIVSVCTSSCNKSPLQNPDNAFLPLKYDKAVAYNYNGEGDIEIIDENGKLAKGIKKSIELDSSQVIVITNVLSDKSTYGGDVASCFDPHLGLVFYKGEKVAGYVSVCLECNYLISSIEIPAAKSGFSKLGGDRIVSFQKEIGF